LVDGSLETAWNSRTGDLTGAWIEVRLPDDATVTSIGMTAGFTHVSPRADLFPGNHRVARVRVLHDGAEVGTYPLDPELRTLQSLPVTGGGGVWRIELAELRPGTRTDWQEACVSELVVMGNAPGARVGAHRPVLSIGTLAALPDPGTEPAGENDGVYFTVQEVGLARLDPTGEWEVVAPGAWGTTLVGTGWLAITTSRIFSSDREPIPAPPSTALSDAALAPDGTVWATGMGHYARWNGSWTIEERAAREPFLSEVAVDGGGTVWLAGESAGLFRLRDGALEPVETPGGRIRDLDVDPGGRLVVTAETAILARSGEAWTTLASGRHWGWSMRGDGALVVLGARGVEVIPTEGAAPRPIALDSLGVPAVGALGVGWDGAGRLWIDTDVGMVVLEPSLAQVARWYPRGTVDELRGTSGTSWIGAIGVPPALPPAERPRGYVHGRLTRAGAPIAGAWVELCPDPSPRYDDDYGGTPCHADEDASGVPTTTTRADGTFHLLDVPEEDLDAAFSVEEGRWVIRDLDCCARPGEIDVGTVSLD
jgi:hypothetical protein